MTEDTSRNPDGTFAEGNNANPNGQNGHPKGWQRYGTRLQKWLEMSGDELILLANDKPRLNKLSVIDIAAIRHAKGMCDGNEFLEYLNNALDHIQGKLTNKNDFTGKVELDSIVTLKIDRA